MLEEETEKAAAAANTPPKPSAPSLPSRKVMRRIVNLTVVGLFVSLGLWLAFGSDDNAPDSEARDYYESGADHLEADEYEAAIADFDQAIAVQPDYVNALWSRGVTYSELGDYEAAIADYDQVIALDDSDLLIYFLRADAYGELGNDEAAAADYQFILDNNPDEELRQLAEEGLTGLSNED